jgi:hypothetical protein
LASFSQMPRDVAASRSSHASSSSRVANSSTGRSSAMRRTIRRAAMVGTAGGRVGRRMLPLAAGIYISGGAIVLILIIIVIVLMLR